MAPLVHEDDMREQQVPWRSRFILAGCFSAEASLLTGAKIICLSARPNHITGITSLSPNLRIRHEGF